MYKSWEDSLTHSKWSNIDHNHIESSVKLSSITLLYDNRPNKLKTDIVDVETISWIFPHDSFPL